VADFGWAPFSGLGDWAAKKEERKNPYTMSGGLINYMLEFLMKRSSVCSRHAGIPAPQSHTIAYKTKRVML